MEICIRACKERKVECAAVSYDMYTQTCREYNTRNRVIIGDDDANYLCYIDLDRWTVDHDQFLNDLIEIENSDALEAIEKGVSLNDFLE